MIRRIQSCGLSIALRIFSAVSCYTSGSIIIISFSGLIDMQCRVMASDPVNAKRYPGSAEEIIESFIVY